MQYRIIACIALFLFLGEVALEGRAHLRGWDTVLFDLASSTGSGSETTGSRFGPSEAFPFRSERVEGASTRVWIASASYAEDSALSPEAIFPHLLQLDLSAPERPIQVLNAARAGNGISANAERLDAIGRVWSPEIVLLYSMSLDIDLLSRRFLAGEPPTAEQVNRGILGPIQPGIRRLGEETTTYSLLKANVTALIAEQKVLAPDLPPEAVERFAAYLDEFVTSVRALGAVPVLTTFAVRTDPEVPLTPEDRKFILRWNQHLSPSGWRRAVEELNGEVVRFAEERGIAVIDVASRIGGREEWFRDLVHFTPEGHRRVAEVMASGLLGIIDELGPIRRSDEVRAVDGSSGASGEDAP